MARQTSVGISAFSGLGFGGCGFTGLGVSWGLGFRGLGCRLGFRFRVQVSPPKGDILEIWPALLSGKLLEVASTTPKDTTPGHL